MEGNFHALVQSKAIYNEWLFIDIMRVERSIVNGLHGGDTLEINRKAINAFNKAIATSLALGIRLTQIDFAINFETF